MQLHWELVLFNDSFIQQSIGLKYQINLNIILSKSFYKFFESHKIHPTSVLCILHCVGDIEEFQRCPQYCPPQSSHFSPSASKSQKIFITLHLIIFYTYVHNLIRKSFFSQNFPEFCLVGLRSHQHCLSSVNLYLPTNTRTVTEAAFKKCLSWSNICFCLKQIFVSGSKKYLFLIKTNIGFYFNNKKFCFKQILVYV